MANLGNEGPSYEQIATRNRYGIRSLQAKYLQSEYERMQQAKNAERMTQKMQKEEQLRMLNKLNENYLNQVSQNRQKKLREMKALSNEYEDFIKSREQKGRFHKYAQKNLEKSTLESPTWIRDIYTERETYKKNMEHYNKALADHVKMQQLRKQAEKQEQHYRKRKINEQADEILKKEMQELQARHRQKSMFEKRQNELLGVKSYYPSQLGASGLLPAETVLRKREQDLYSQGLSLQLRKQQEKRYGSAQDKMSSVNTNIYNPITNPIPFVYKNPNVLRMMSNN